MPSLSGIGTSERECIVSAESRNRFQDFFEAERYVALKNHLYNYLLRRAAIEDVLARENCDLILEVGSGISPVMTKTDRIVFSELSPLACRTLKRLHGRGENVAADGTRLPFRDGSFSHAVCSEVLEHADDDRGVIFELARVLRVGGRLVVTFPHCKFYFANDDRYVAHRRRYEEREMVEMLEAAGLTPVSSRKVLGPLDKIAMMAAVLCFETFQRLGIGSGSEDRPGRLMGILAPFFVWANRVFMFIERVDAWVVPRSLATCLLIEAEKRP